MISNIRPERHKILQPVIEYAESLGYPSDDERDSFFALVDAVDLRLGYLEHKATMGEHAEPRGSEFIRLLGVRPSLKQIKILAYLFELSWVDGRNEVLATTLSWRVSMDHKTLFRVLRSLNYRGLIYYGGLEYDSLDWYPGHPDYRRKYEQFEIFLQPGALAGIAAMLTKYLWPGHVAWHGLAIYNKRAHGVTDHGDVTDMTANSKAKAANTAPG